MRNPRLEGVRISECVRCDARTVGIVVRSQRREDVLVGAWLQRARLDLHQPPVDRLRSQRRVGKQLIKERESVLVWVDELRLDDLHEIYVGNSSAVQELRNGTQCFEVSW